MPAALALFAGGSPATSVVVGRANHRCCSTSGVLRLPVEPGLVLFAARALEALAERFAAAASCTVPPVVWLPPGVGVALVVAADGSDAAELLLHVAALPAPGGTTPLGKLGGWPVTLRGGS